MVTIKELRTILRGQMGVSPINPFDFTQLSLEYLVNTELMHGCDYVCVDEIEPGFRAYGGLLVPSLDGGKEIGERAVVDVSLLLDPMEWRRSARYREWRMRRSEIFT